MSAFDQLVPLPGSEKTAPDATPLDTLAPNQVLTVTVRVNRKKSLTPMVSTKSVVNTVISRSAYASQYGAEPAVLKQVEAFATAYDLSLVEQSAARRSVLLRGTVAQLERAFGVSLANYRMADGTVVSGSCRCYPCAN